MRIDSGATGMESARSYTASSVSYRRFELTEYTGVGNGLGGTGSGYAGLLSGGQKEEEEVTDTKEKRAVDPDKLLNLQEKMASVRRNYSLRNSEETGAETIRQQTIQYIFELLFKDYRQRFRDWMEEQGFGPKIGNGTSTYYDHNSGVGAVTVGSSMVDAMQVQVSRLDYKAVQCTYESENTTFSTTGMVRCADGREIRFHVDVSMSREFSSYYEVDLGLSTIQVTDPLVIHLNGNVPGVSDQKIYFDIDGDGEKDQVNALSEGSMYLAYDRNGDGEINDGRELFGAGTGDGFGELAEFDTDGDGWIDEDDDIFDKLVVWSMDASGNTVAYSLKEAGVGAICLSKAETQFAVTDWNNQSKAFVRSTGVFLYENGSAGVVQQLDMAKYKQEA